MIVNSLAFKTDLFFHRFNGEVFDRDKYLCIRTPSNPSFFWGNLLYYSEPPTQTSYNDWTAQFTSQFSAMNVHHMTFAWDSIDGSTGQPQEFLKNGFVLEESIVMVAEEIRRPSKVSTEFSIKPISTEEHWDAVISNQVRCRASHFKEDLYWDFVRKKMANQRKMITAGKGKWMGAFLDDKLVGDLGIFVENGLERFQTVGTDPEFRRRGVCSTLVHETCLHAKKEMGAKTLVMVADPEYHAARIYESVGFEPREKHVGLYKWDREKWG